MFAIINGIRRKEIFMLEKVLNSCSYEVLKTINKLLDSGHNEIISIIKQQYNGANLEKILNRFEQGYDDVVNIFGECRFNYFQVEEILLGLEDKIDVSIYADSKNDDKQMREIRLGLKNGVDVSVNADSKFDDEQRKQIIAGVKNGVNVSIYANPKFDDEQMREIRLGLEFGIDVTIYADSKFDYMQMREIRLGLEEGVDVLIYADPKFDYMQMYEIREGLLDGINVLIYADPKFDYMQMRNIRDKLKEEIGIRDIACNREFQISKSRRNRKIDSDKNMIVKDIIQKINAIKAEELIKGDKLELESILKLLETENAIEIEILNSLLKTQKIKMDDIANEILATNNAKYIYLFAKNIDDVPYKLLIDALIRIQNFEYIYKSLADVVFVDRDYSNDINFYTAFVHTSWDVNKMRDLLRDKIKKQEEKMSGFQRYLEFNYQPLLRTMNNCKDYPFLEEMLRKYPPCSNLIYNKIRKIITGECDIRNPGKDERDIIKSVRDERERKFIRDYYKIKKLLKDESDIRKPVKNEREETYIEKFYKIRKLLKDEKGKNNR